MRLYDYVESLPIPFTYKNNIASTIIGYSTKMTYANYCSKTKKFIIPDDYKIPENYLDLMVIVNRMVKSQECPSNYKNRFYGYKTKVIEETIKEGRVSDVYDEGNCIALVVDGKYKFHQLKFSYAGKHLTPIGVREYKHEEVPTPFDEETYKSFQLAATLYLGKRSLVNRGLVSEPKDLESQEPNYNPDNYTDEIPLGLYLKLSALPISTRVAIATIIIDGNNDGRTMSKHEYFQKTANYMVPKDFALPTNELELMHEVGRMLHDKNFPKNLKTRYKRSKKRIIESYNLLGKVTDVYNDELRNSWNVLVDGKYRFNVSKTEKPNGYPKEFKGTKEIQSVSQIPFDMNKFNEFQLASLFYLGRKAANI